MVSPLSFIRSRSEKLNTASRKMTPHNEKMMIDDMTESRARLMAPDLRLFFFPFLSTSSICEAPRVVGTTTEGV